MQVVIGIALVLAAASVAGAGPLDTPGAMKALNCSACHGFAGQSAGDTMPILAGLWPEYFKKAIADYASGKRPSTEMEPYAKQVIQFGVDDYAAYFGGLTREPTKIAVGATAAGRGRAAAQPCVICHGPDGRGDRAKLIPDLTGQPPGYLKNQMMLFREDKRSPGDPSLKAIKELMKSLSDDTMNDLAAYYSSIR
jgi:cytochrome c553